jgi:RHS repeat-associated protein
MGNRVYKASYDGSRTTVQKFIVDIAGTLSTIVAEYSADPNSFTNSYVYADGQVLVQYAHSGDPNVPDDKYYYVHDRLGSVRMVVDANSIAQTVTARNIYTYSPFGNPYAGTVSETVYNPFQFTGQWFDAEINQYYLRARQYDPTTMRFMTRDPVKGKYKEPLTLHRYLYCVNEPVGNIDPSGENAMASALVAPVMAGHGTHAFAVAVVATGVVAMNWNCIDFGIAIDQSIGMVMASVAVGVNYWDALIHSMKGGKQKDRDSFGKLKDIAEEYGKTLEELRDAIHKNKKYYRPDGGDLDEEAIREILENM